MMLLSFISNSVTCSKNENNCIFNSQIKYLNVELNKDILPFDSINNIVCEKKVQPSKRGSKSYYQLAINNYNISTYQKYKECKTVEHSIKQDIKNPEINYIKFTSSSGFINFLGGLFAFIALFVGFIILKSKDEPENFSEDSDDE